MGSGSTKEKPKKEAVVKEERQLSCSNAGGALAAPRVSLTRRLNPETRGGARGARGRQPGHGAALAGGILRGPCGALRAP